MPAGAPPARDVTGLPMPIHGQSAQPPIAKMSGSCAVCKVDSTAG